MHVIAYHALFIQKITPSQIYESTQNVHICSPLEVEVRRLISETRKVRPVAILDYTEPIVLCVQL